MKKLFFLTFMFLGFVLSASAQMENIYAFRVADDGSCGDFASKYMIDRNAKKFRFDSDSEDDAKMLIKNYKKVGTKETFDLYPEIDPSTKICSMELIIDPEQKTATNPKHQTITVKWSGRDSECFAVKTEEQNGAGSKSTMGAQKPQAAAGKATPTPEDKAESGIKKTLNKGLGVFKKKK